MDERKALALVRFLALVAIALMLAVTKMMGWW
jgi:hypothetical protein